MTPRLPSGWVASALLSGPGLVYGAGVRLRNALYDAGYFASRALPCPVISIGNLTVGGTGKTPLTSFVAGLLSDSGYRVGVLSRGYRRRSGPAPLLVSDGRTLLADPEQAGDEPYLLARDHPAVAVAVGADRVEAARLLCSAISPEVIVLDDAFQHRRVRRDLDLLLVDGLDPWGNGRMLPLGPLREPPSSVSRADALVVTRAGDHHHPGLAALLERHNPSVEVFHARIEARGYVGANGEVMDRSALKGFAAFVFSGIARPERFEEDLRRLGVRVVGSQRFPDHHRYRSRVMEDIARKARTLGAEVMVTTEKDLVRITRSPEGALPLYALRLNVSFPPRSNLAAFILDRLRALGSPGSRRTAR